MDSKKRNAKLKSAVQLLMYGRADGMPSFQLTVAVRARDVCWTQYVDAGLSRSATSGKQKYDVRAT
jgi:hypothetical protein